MRVLCVLALCMGAGCGGSGAGGGGPSALGESPTLTGHVGMPVGAAGSVDASGKFSVVLPSRADLAPFMKPYRQQSIAPPCPAGYFQVTGADAQMASMFGLMFPAASPVQIDVITPSTHVIYINYVYVDRDLSMTGTYGGQKCAVDFKAGWNYYADELDTTSGAMYTRYDWTGALPAGTQWQLGL